MHGFYQGWLVFRAQSYPDATAFHSKFNGLFFMSRLYISVGVPRSDDGNQRVTTGEPKLVEICDDLRLIPAWFHLNKYIQEDCYE